MTTKPTKKAFDIVDKKINQDSDSLPKKVSISYPLVIGNSTNTKVTINNQIYPGVIQKSVQNVLVLTENDDEIKDCLIYNIFADDVFFVKCPPWESKASFKPHPLRDDEILNYRAWVDTRGLTVGKNDAMDILISIARRNIVNPPKDYFESLKWDKKPRLDKWLDYYLSAKDQNTRYLQLVGSKWLIGIVKRIYEPGAKFDNVLILEGNQYIGKSKTLEELATINGERYFTDESIDFRSKDSLMLLQGKLIIEMPELASFRKAETDQIKGFITRRVDEYRPPYGRKVAPRPRMFGISGSVNPTAGYLTDPTGNRRYWPVKCGSKIDMAGLIEAKEQLWAEATYRYKQGEQIWLNPEEHDLAELEQKDRLIEDLIQERIEKEANKLVYANWNKDFYLNELIDAMDIPLKDRDGRLGTRITNCLTALKYIEYRPRVDGKQIRKWKMAEKEEKVAED